MDNETDAKRLWFIYTRNRAIEASWDATVEVVISSPQLKELFIAGEISADLIAAGSQWFSFGGSPLHEASEFAVSSASLGEHLLKNAHHLDSLKNLLPRYEPSEKHRQQAYRDARGEHVSAMPLNPEEAQTLLLISVRLDSDRWAYHEGRRRYYRFKPTYPDLSVYHGFVSVK